jgi:hypothetical protein
MASNPAERPPSPYSSLPRVLVATTAMLTFISFWRAAAVVPQRPRFIGVLCGRHRRTSHWSLGAVVHPGGDAVRLRRLPDVP